MLNDGNGGQNSGGGGPPDRRLIGKSAVIQDLSIASGSLASPMESSINPVADGQRRALNFMLDALRPAGTARRRRAGHPDRRA